MPTITNNFTDFHREPFEKVKEALFDVLVGKDQLTAGGNQAIIKLYAYAQPIAVVAEQNNPPDRLLQSQHELIRYLDPGAMANFILTPENKLNRDVLATQLVMVAAAVTDVIAIKPYSLEELKRIFKGENQLYDDGLFINTLRSSLEGGPNAAEIGRLVVASLPVAVAPEPGEEAAVMWWDHAFVQAVMLHAAWKQFPLLPPAQQQFLLQNYFYAGVVAGFGVKSVVIEFLASQNNAKSLAGATAAMVHALANNQEVVPLSVSESDGEFFNELLKKYLASVLSAEIETLAQEKFLESIYRNQASAAAYTGWLREALSLAFHIKKGDIV